MPYRVSATWKAALAASRQRKVTVAQVWHGQQYLATLPNVTAGSVTGTETAEIRRTSQITIVSQGRGRDQWVPVNPTDLLHPATGNELRIWRGFRYAGGITELAPLGVFGLSKPKITDSGTSLALTLTGNDRAASVKRQAFTTPYLVAQGTQFETLVQAIISARIPGCLFNLFPTSTVLNAGVFAATPAGGTNDPMACLQTLAASYGLELYFDPLGVCTTRPIPTPNDLSTSWSFVEGQTCTMATLTKELDETATYNGVVCIGNGKAKTVFSTPTPTTNHGSAETTIPPVYAAVWTENPDSPTNIAGPWGKVPKFIVTTAIPRAGDLAKAQAEIDAMAQAQFPLVVTALNTVTFGCVANAAMWEGDVVQITRARAGVATRYVISGFTCPLGSTNETVSCRPQSQVVNA